MVNPSEASRPSEPLLRRFLSNLNNFLRRVSSTFTTGVAGYKSPPAVRSRTNRDKRFSHSSIVSISNAAQQEVEDRPKGVGLEALRGSGANL